MNSSSSLNELRTDRTKDFAAAFSLKDKQCI